MYVNASTCQKGAGVGPPDEPISVAREHAPHRKPAGVSDRGVNDILDQYHFHGRSPNRAHLPREKKWRDSVWLQKYLHEEGNGWEDCMHAQ